MQKHKKIVGALASFALLALLIALTPPGRAIAQDARVLLVEVVNIPNVNLNQPVTIGNPPGSPVPVVSVGLPARQPFLANVVCTGTSFCARGLRSGSGVRRSVSGGSNRDEAGNKKARRRDACENRAA